MVPYGRLEITLADIDAVVTTLPSDYLPQGPLLLRFQGELAAHVGARYALAVNTATSAIQKAIRVDRHYIRAHNQEEATGVQASDFAQAGSSYSEAMRLSLYQGLAEGQQERLVAAIDEALVV